VVKLEPEAGVVSIVLSRAEKRNALTPEMFEDLDEAVAEAGGRQDARALVLAGEGPVFCGGFDLRMCLDRPGTLEQLLESLARLVEAIQALPIPVVIAAHGAAIAGGCALLAAGDVVVTDRRSKIGYPVVPLGISPAVSAATLREAVGDGRARERLLDPALISGEEAVRIGLAHELVETGALVRPRALEIARALAAKPPGAMATTKRWLHEVAERMRIADAPGHALRASLAIVGGEEERDRLTGLFSKR
jgi:methylglutaconyl-CoA hydratase